MPFCCGIPIPLLLAFLAAAVRRRVKLELIDTAFSSASRLAIFAAFVLSKSHVVCSIGSARKIRQLFVFTLSAFVVVKARYWLVGRDSISIESSDLLIASRNEIRIFVGLVIRMC